MHTQLKDILATAAKESLRPQVDEAFGEFKRLQQRRLFAMRGALAIAAAVLLFLIAPLFLTTTANSPEALFVQNFELPVEPSVQRGADSDRQWIQALNAYDQAQYATAAGFIKNALKNPAFEDKSSAYYLLGLCFSAEAQYDKAIENLEKVSETGILFPDAQWYIALFCLKTKDLEKAKRYLKEMAGNDGHFKQRKAAEILEKLK
jgi:tetratricopeptide (TPR) repeat protein